MSRIRSANTKPELLVRSMLHGMGLRFRLNRRTLPGTPDIVLPKYRTVVLVHGCFWHRHKGCQFSYSPKSRKEWWSAKFLANTTRDRRTLRKLRRLGWNVVTVWECEVRHSDALSKRLKKLFGKLKRQVELRQMDH